MISDDIATLSDQIVVKFKEVELILVKNSTLREREIWLKQVKSHIRLYNKAIRGGNLHIGALRKLQTNLGHIKRFKNVIECQNFIGGGGLLKEKRGDRVKWEDLTSIFQGRVRTGIIINLKHKDINQFFNDAFHLFKIRILNAMKKNPMLKVNSCFCGEFVRKSGETEIIEKKYFNTKNQIIDEGVDLNQWFQTNIKDCIFNALSEFSDSGSGWALQTIVSLEININKYEVGNGASSYIKLPEQIAKKHACINVKNKDEACFAWSIVSAFYPVDANSDRTSSYPHYAAVLNVDGIEFPMTLPQIAKFEKNNSISVNVFGLEMDLKAKFSVVPVRLTKQKFEKHVNLLIVQNEYFPKINDFNPIPEDDEQEVEIKYHYCYIKDLSRLLNKLNEHTEYCEKLNDCKVEFSREPYVQFKNFVYKEKVPFIMYADFESLLEPLNDVEISDSELATKTSRYQKHNAYSAGYYFKCNYNNSWSSYNSNRGSNCMSWFADELTTIAKFVSSKLKHVEDMNVEVFLKDATKSCHICELDFKQSDKIVRDHCHLTGDFRGFAHNQCNLNYKNSFVIPVVFHNLGGYDAHFIIKELAQRSRVTLLPINKEKYISFTVYDNDTNIKFRFIDSIRFMGCSLDQLASTLVDENFKDLKQEFSDLDDGKLKLLMRKGVFFYDYLDKIERLDETKLPNIEHFYNKLNDTNIDETDYAHAQLIWRTFNIQTLGEYSDLYMKTDIMLLTSVFETFRETCHKTYKIDPGRHFTLPGYTWDCMLKYTGCKLETLQDVDMLMFIERGIRGGISQCCNRFSQANNKYLDDYDSNKPSTYLMYFDVNNLYGWAMSQPLPSEGFQWSDTNIDVTTVPDDGEIGYILEVDLEYPETLHDLHKDLPLCAEHRTPPNSKFPKLMTTLYPKDRYVIHYRNLKQALQHGLKLIRIHKVLKFKQSTWLKSYIDLNTSLRAKAESDFEKNNFKLMNNAVFGKSMQNVRKHRIVKLVNKWEGRYGAKNLIASPNFESRSIFSDTLMAIEMKKSHIVFDKPLYVGMAILDISKTCVYEFHYDYMLQKFPVEKCKLLYTDTDSLVYELQCNDAYEEVIGKDIDRFDTSDYPKDNHWNIPLVNKKVPGLMKDENNGKLMTHFVGLRSKQYTYKVEGGENVKKSKGVKSNVVKRKITFEDYLNCLEKPTESQGLLHTTQRCIQSKLHDVYSVEQTKIALNAFDDKRHILPGVHDTLPWGHYSIMEEEDL
ncbi:hypothetical protein NQ317_005459 [Molorchus minor]|uniref:DNA-directed DNA polymerase n=1 Tax=Molorchus minor TaxID=1323400 RepID=A0ABQ9J553_9CUCU|nr:hypothetical protein NQ317_005459 [Molorchus minor]